MTFKIKRHQQLPLSWNIYMFEANNSKQVYDKTIHITK